MSSAVLSPRPVHPSGGLSTSKDLPPFPSLRELGITSDDEAEFEAQAPKFKVSPGATPLFSSNPPYPTAEQLETARNYQSLLDSFDATISQRHLLFEQLRQAEEETREALFTLHLLQQETDQESYKLQCFLEDAMNAFGKDVVGELIKKATFASKYKWEDEWDYEWVDSDDEEINEKIVEHPENATTSSQHPDPSSSGNAPDEQPNASGSGAIHDDEINNEAAQGSPTMEYGDNYLPKGYSFEVPREFITLFGPIAYNPIPAESGPSHAPPKRKPRRLQRDYMRVVVPADGGGPVLIDTRATMEAHRESTRRMVRARQLAQEGRHHDLENDLWQITRPDLRKLLPVNWCSYEEEFGSVADKTQSLGRNPFESTV